MDSLVASLVSHENCCNPYSLTNPLIIVEIASFSVRDQLEKKNLVRFSSVKGPHICTYIRTSGPRGQIQTFGSVSLQVTHSVAH
jgi:hypothetical protein